MLDVIRTIFVKEALDLLRDHRALFFLFAIPLVMPLLGAAGGAFVLWQVIRQTRGGLPVTVINAEQLPELTAKLKDSSMVQVADPPPNLERALQDGEVVAALEIPADAEKTLQSKDSITLTLTSSRSGWKADLAVSTVTGAIDKYADQVLEERLADMALSRRWLEPFHVKRRATATTGVASASVVAESTPTSLASIFLPFVIVSWVFSGGLSLVAHMTVGEKERHTMEPMLVTQADRVGIVLGKAALSTLVSAITIGLWSLDSLGYVFLLSILPSQASAPGTPIPIQLGDMGIAIVWLVLLMLPLMIMANGLVMAVCTFAKNYRESHLFLGVLQLLLPGLALLAAFGIEANPSLTVYALPAVGSLVAVRDLFQSGLTPGVLALTWTTSALYAAGAVLLAAYVFSREWALMRGM